MSSLGVKVFEEENKNFHQYRLLTQSSPFFYGFVLDLSVETIYRTLFGYHPNHFSLIFSVAVVGYIPYHRPFLGGSIIPFEK